MTARTERGDDLAGVADEGRDDEGHVEGGDAGLVADGGDDLAHGVGHDGHDEGAEDDVGEGGAHLGRVAEVMAVALLLVVVVLVLFLVHLERGVAVRGGTDQGCLLVDGAGAADVRAGDGGHGGGGGGVRVDHAAEETLEVVGGEAAVEVGVA